MKHEKIEVGNESVGGLLQWEGGVLVGGSLKFEVRVRVFNSEVVF